jgi:MFS family permease
MPDERSSLLGSARHGQDRLVKTATLARLVTFASSFSEGWEIAIFALVLLPITKEFRLTSMEVGLLASLPLAAAAIGYMCMAWVMDIVGRKPIIMATYVIQCAGCIMMASASDLLSLGIGRAVLSIGIKSGVTCVSVYMTELSPAASRGALVSIEEIYLNVGILAATCAAWVMMGLEMVSWRVFVAVGAIAPALSLAVILLPQVPESPRFLHAQGRAQEALVILRSAVDDDEEEVSRTLALWREEAKDIEKRSHMTWVESVEEFRQLFSHRGFQTAAGCWLARAGSGIAIMGTYGALFLSGNGMSEEMALRWFFAAQIAKTLAIIPSVLWLLDKYGRRTLFLVSAWGCCLCMVTAAVCKLGRFSFAFFAGCLVAYFIAFSIGYGPVVWVYCFEILPGEIRGRAAAVSILVGDVLNFVLITIGPLLWQMHVALPFSVLAVTNLLAIAFYWAVCPETKGLLLEEAKNII